MKEYWMNLTLLNKVKFVFSMILGIIGVIFATLNWKEQEVNLIVTSFKIPLTLLIIFSVIVGFALSFVFNYSKIVRKDDEIDELKREIERLK